MTMSSEVIVPGNFTVEIIPDDRTAILVNGEEWRRPAFTLGSGYRTKFLSPDERYIMKIGEDSIREHRNWEFIRETEHARFFTPILASGVLPHGAVSIWYKEWNISEFIHGLEDVYYPGYGQEDDPLYLQAKTIFNDLKLRDFGYSQIKRLPNGDLIIHDYEKGGPATQ